MSRDPIFKVLVLVLKILAFAVRQTYEIEG